MKPGPDMVSDDADVWVADNPAQKEAIVKLRDLLKRLRKAKPPHSGGMVFLEKQVDAQGNVSLRMAINEGLAKVETVSIQFNILTDDYKKTCLRIEDEYVELVRALFRSTYAPDLYIDDGSPVRLTKLRTAKDMDLT